jgi:hypothetical protein
MSVAGVTGLEHCAETRTAAVGGSAAALRASAEFRASQGQAFIADTQTLAFSEGLTANPTSNPRSAVGGFRCVVGWANMQSVASRNNVARTVPGAHVKVKKMSYRVCHWLNLPCVRGQTGPNLGAKRSRVAHPASICNDEWGRFDPSPLGPVRQNAQGGVAVLARGKNPGLRTAPSPARFVTPAQGRFSQ